MQIHHLALVFTSAQAYTSLCVIAFLTLLLFLAVLSNLKLNHQVCMRWYEKDTEKSLRRRAGHNALDAAHRHGVRDPLVSWAVAMLTDADDTERELTADSLHASLGRVLAARAVADDRVLTLDAPSTARLLFILDGLFERIRNGDTATCPRLAKPAFEEIQHRLGYIRSLIVDDSDTTPGPRIDPGQVLGALEIILNRAKLANITRNKTKPNVQPATT